MKRRLQSYETLTFVFFALTREGEVICVSEPGGIKLPQYEFQECHVRHGSECVTDVLARQMPDCIGYAPGGEVALAESAIRGIGEEEKTVPLAAILAEDDDDDEDEPPVALEPYRADFPFRVCVAKGCLPRTKEAADDGTAPFVRWARDTMEYRPFPEWDRMRRERAEREQRIVLVPEDEWHEMLQTGKVTDRTSVAATEAALAWTAQPRSLSFGQKKDKGKMTKK